MLRGLLVSRVLNKTNRFLTNIPSPPFTNHHHQLAPCAFPFGWFNRCRRIHACPYSISSGTLLISPSGSSVEHSLLSSSSCLDRVLRKFCTLSSFELERASDSGETDYVDKVYKIVLDHSSPEYKMELALDKLGIELTTPLVVEILERFHFEEKIAFRFFNWAGHQEHYSHEPESYNKMIDILSSTKYKVKQFRIVCDLLDYMKRSNKNSVPIEVLLTILRKYTEKHLTHLQKFAKKKKIRVKTQPEINAFNLLLDAMCKCCLVEDAEAMFKRVKSKVKPNADTYNILFFGWCRVRNPNRSMSVLKDMIEMGFKPENFTYNTAIDTFCKAGMLTEARELLKFMKANGSTMSSPTAKTYAIMMVALIQNDKFDECFEILADMIESGCLPDVSTYKELIDGMCLSGKIEAAYKFLDEMGKTGYPPDIVTYNCFLKVLCDNKNTDEAIGLYKKMNEKGVMPSVQTYNILIEMFFGIHDSDGAFETWDEMDRRGCRRDTDTYCVMIEGLFGCDNNKDAMFLLERVIDMGMKFPYKKFDSFLLKLSEIGDLQAIQRLSEHMRRFYNPAMARRFALNQKRKSMSFRGK
ncbi:hypothetical protein CASFOL_021411 [Castilleja foliolosa]|uniref:Pentatricopeptide repeat-containing protein n=1 Tax=Castilleja foliolosa TaxID=1961234 RepID=A0ABD3CY06_9LAMI